jgi:hypothetical protein
VDVYPGYFMIYGNREKLWFVKIEPLRSKAVLYQFQNTIQGDGASTGGLISRDVVGSIFRL